MKKIFILLLTLINCIAITNSSTAMFSNTHDTPHTLPSCPPEEGVEDHHNENKKEIDREELQKKLHQFNTECEKAAEDEVVAITKYLYNNPDVKNEYQDLIREITENTWHKATNCKIACDTDTFTVTLHENFKNYSKRDAALAKAHEHLTCADNCSNVFSEFQKLLTTITPKLSQSQDTFQNQNTDIEEPKVFTMNINRHKFMGSLPIDPANFNVTKIVYHHHMVVGKSSNTLNDLSKAIDEDSFTKTIQSLDPTIREYLVSTIRKNKGNIDCVYCPSVNGLVMYKPGMKDFSPSPKICKFLEERDILSRPKYVTTNPEFQ